MFFFGMQLSPAATIYLFCAASGTCGFFFGSFVRLLFGSLDAELGLHDIHIHDIPDIHHAGSNFSDSLFRLLSVTAITGFLMLFGWVGLATELQYNFSTLWSFVCAFSAGLATIITYQWSISIGAAMTHEGCKINLPDAIGKHARVYRTIRQNNSGTVQLFIGGMIREVCAHSADHTTITSGSNVTIVAVQNEHIIIVKKYKE